MDLLCTPHGVSTERCELVQASVGELLQLARGSAERAYAPYSKFHVGAAVLAQNDLGETDSFIGCNVENASYGATMCAERSAIFSAVSAGYRQIQILALSTTATADHPELSMRSPCGLCRQVISEFASEKTLIAIDGGTKNGKQNVDLATIDTLLPWRFQL